LPAAFPQVTVASADINIDYSIFRSLQCHRQCVRGSGRDCQLTKLMQFSPDEGILFFMSLS
jgi:hypothetical protein